MILKGITTYPKPRTTKGYNGSKDPFYQSRLWKGLRAMKIQSDPLCEVCLSEGKTTAGHTVDHIIPRNQGGKDTINNLRTLCQHHNAVKTALDNPNNQYT